MSRSCSHSFRLASSSALMDRHREASSSSLALAPCMPWDKVVSRKRSGFVFQHTRIHAHEMDRPVERPAYLRLAFTVQQQLLH